MKKIIILVCVLLLGGCSAKFAYNNVDWLIYWYLDDYVELNNEQEDMFDDMLSSWKLWHKQDELPQYQSQLEDIVADIKSKNINEQTIISHRERARGHWVRARAHLAPDLVRLGATLSQDQVIYLFANLEKKNVEDDEEMLESSTLDSEERAKKWVKRNQKGIKKWLGKLSEEQKEHISTFYDSFESTGPYWTEYKREYQQQLREVFALSTRDETFQERLHELVVDPEQFRTPEFQSAMEVNTQASTEYMIGIMALSTDKQINRLLDEISEFQKDLISLQK
ncbi:MAG: hypothetical protein ACJAVV_001749 [Alphaproteobacteria bacterium]|jgi:hypothetical protein